MFLLLKVWENRQSLTLAIGQLDTPYLGFVLLKFCSYFKLSSKYGETPFYKGKKTCRDKLIKLFSVTLFAKVKKLDTAYISIIDKTQA